ncbi:MAG: hypothetical protein EB167_08735, partial [Nitrososphaeria archaeon]|nr:hypothetical protein [Nitrososphaeria archaeon]
ITNATLPITNATLPITNATLPITNATLPITNATDVQTNSTESIVIIPDPVASLNADSIANNTHYVGNVAVNETGINIDGGYVKIDDPITNKNMTISVWLKPNYLPGYTEYVIASKQNSFKLTLNNIVEPTHKAKFSIFDGTQYYAVRSRVEIPENWTHLAASFDGDKLSIYVNGTLSSVSSIKSAKLANGVTSSEQTDLPDTDSDILIGTSSDLRIDDNTAGNFFGSLDKLEIYDQYLTEEQISGIYNDTVSDIAKPIITDEIPQIEQIPIQLLNQTQTNSTLNTNSTEFVITSSIDTVGAFTLSAWVLPNYERSSDELTIFSKENSFILSINNILDPKHTPKFSVFDGIKWTDIASSHNIEGLTHIAAVVNGTDMYLYVNGTLSQHTVLDKVLALSNGQSILVPNEVADSGSEIIVGAYLSTVRKQAELSNKFSGIIDQPLLFTSALSDSQDLYHKQMSDVIQVSLTDDLTINDEIASTTSNITSTITFDTVANNTSTLTHDEIEINKPVTWTQLVQIDNNTQTIGVEIPADAKSVQVNELDQNNQPQASDSKIIVDETAIQNPISTQSENSTNTKLNEIISNNGIETIIPLADAKYENLDAPVQEDKPTKLIIIDSSPNPSEQTSNSTQPIIDSNGTEYKIQFETSAPYTVETNNSTNDMFIKQVTVQHDSTLHYTNVKSYSDIPERLTKTGASFKLFWSINSTTIDVTNDSRFQVEYLDTDGNGLVDRMQWIVPQLSEQTFQIQASILVLNVQSYPVVGDTWQVRFTTNGTADLIISAINATSFGTDLPDDLKLLSIRCGDTVLDHQWVGSSAVVSNYTCNDTGYETSQVITPGVHNLEFSFGNATAYANNNAIFVNTIGTQGTGNGQFRTPIGVVINSTGFVYVADTGNDRVQIFTSGGGAYSSQFGTQGTGNGQFDGPTGIAVNSTGYVYVADTGNDRVVILNKSGTFISSFGSSGSSNGLFDGPTGISVNSTGYVYVADTGNDRVQIFAPSGGYVGKFGAQGTGNGQFQTPIGVVVDSSGYVRVADTGNDRIILVLETSPSLYL